MMNIKNAPNAIVIEGVVDEIGQLEMGIEGLVIDTGSVRVRVQGLQPSQLRAAAPLWTEHVQLIVRLRPPAGRAAPLHSLITLLQEARATFEMWKDVAPAVSLCADIDKALAADYGWQQPLLDAVVALLAQPEIVELACTGSDAPVENALGHLQDVVNAIIAPGKAQLTVVERMADGVPAALLQDQQAVVEQAVHTAHEDYASARLGDALRLILDIVARRTLSDAEVLHFRMLLAEVGNTSPAVIGKVVGLAHKIATHFPDPLAAMHCDGEPTGRMLTQAVQQLGVAGPVLRKRA